MHIADRLLTAVAPHVSALGSPAIARTLSRQRQEVTDRLAAEVREQAAEIGQDIEAGVPGAQQRLAELAADTLQRHRREVAQRAGGLGQLAARIDKRWYRPDLPELLDDPQLDPSLRENIMARLDDINHKLHNYEAFVDALLPLCHRDRPTRILDLAAGHGGFAIAATQIAARRGYELSFLATDIKQEYLDMGAAEASRLGVDVQFATQNALDLSNLEPGAFDLVISTQSLHHFPPGLIAVMFRSAVLAAGEGVVLIDGCRSLLTGLGLASWGLAHDRQWRSFSHDAWRSCRKFFVPEELALLCRIGPWGDDVVARWMPPGHIVATAAR